MYSGRSFAIAVVLSLLMCLFGFLLFELELIAYGFTLFCVMPVIIGYVLALRPTFWITMFFGGVIGMAVFCYLLVIGGAESMFCVLTLSPLLLILFFAGMLMGYHLNKNKKDEEEEGPRVNVYVWPLLLLLASGSIEHFFVEKYDNVEVVSKIVLPYSPELVFDNIKSVDTLTGEVPFIMKIGVQRPLRCELEKDSVGAKRICYFNEGTIDEIVTEIDRGKTLKMKVTSYNMPGRKWLHFEDAIYEFKAVAGGTELTRITTYRTELKPRFYWQYFEKKAVETEHAYVLKDLENRMKTKYK